MKMKILMLAVATAAAVAATAVLAATPVDQLLQEYQGQGATAFNADAARRMWTQEFRDAETGKNRSCSTCHGQDLRQPGKHAKTGKRIDPLAPSANPERLTDVKEMRKWFKRNCKWTIGRECTAQEKGDVLTWLRTL